jgi:hypothetical protein
MMWSYIEQILTEFDKFRCIVHTSSYTMNVLYVH